MTSEWHPFETAPKDGDDVIFWVVSYDGTKGWLTVARWGCDGNFDNWVDGGVLADGNPTHWMRPGPPGWRDPTEDEPGQGSIDDGY